MSVTCPDGHVSASDDYCDVCGAPIAAGGGSPVVVGGAAAGSRPASGAVPAQGGPSPLTLPGPVVAEQDCPNCGAPASPDALFCEDCGYDFTTGALPEPLQPPDTPPTAPTPVQPAAAPAATAAPAVTQAMPTGPDEGPDHSPNGGAAGAPAVEWMAEIWVDPDWYDTQDSEDPCPSAGAPLVVRIPAGSVLIGRKSVSRNIHPQIDCGSDSGVSRRHAQLTTDGRRWWVEDLRSANGTYVGSPGAPLPEDPLEPGRRTEIAGADRIYLGAWTRIVVRQATPVER